MRPKSIVRFQWVYIAIIVAGIVASALGWDDMMASVAVQRMVARYGMATVWGPVAAGILIQLLFLYFIARRGSVIAKWIFVILTGLGTAWSAYAIVAHGAPTVALGVLNVAQVVLQVIAIVLVFQPDTRPWFGEDAAGDMPEAGEDA